MRKLIVWSLLCMAGVAREAASQLPSLPTLQGATVNVIVSTQPSSDLLRYEYRVQHLGSQLNIENFAVDISSDSTRVVLSSQGLQFTSPVLNETAELYLSRLGKEKAAVAGSVSEPTGWQATLVDRDGPKITWRATVDGQLITPGNSRVFTALSRGLPAIRDSILEPDVFDLIPSLDSVDEDADDVLAARRGTWQRPKTIGPKAPPASFVPTSFLDEIDAMRSPAVTNGWIDTSSTSQTIGSSLQSIRSKLSSGDMAGAINDIGTLLASIDSMSCKQYSCTPAKQLTSEAYALLTFNLDYLRKHQSVQDADGDGILADGNGSGVVGDVVCGGGVTTGCDDNCPKTSNANQVNSLEGANPDKFGDACDLCRYFSTTQNIDTNGDGRGDDCQCGDADGNGFVNVSDIVAINYQIFNPPPSPLCDANNSNTCNVSDLIAVNTAIFSGTATNLTCARHPVAP